jgi:hypothetical protein
MPKKIYRQLLRCQSKQEIAELLDIDYEKDGDYVWLGDITSKYEIDEISDECYKINKNKRHNIFFKDKALNDYFNDDTTLFKVSQEDLLELINLYEQKIISFYQNKIKKIKEEKEENIEKAYDSALVELQYTLTDWASLGAVDKSLDKKHRIVKSWSYEYNIFDLLFLYKSVNFNTHILFVRGG